MGIISITTDVAGQSGVFPRRVKIICTDNLATVTAAGYLNPVSLEGYTIYNTDLFDIWYGATGTPGNPPAITNPGTYSEFQNTIVNGVITLVNTVTSGDVLLPVVSGDFATFNGTSGQIKDAGYLPSNAAKTNVVMAGGATTANGLVAFADTSGTVQNPSTTSTTGFGITAATGNLTATTGNIIATAGTLISGSAAGGNVGTAQLFSTTAAKGSLAWEAANNSGNTATVFTTASYGQASTITYPDPAGAAANGVLAPAALVSGNLISASGTAGLIQNAGISATSVSSAITQIGNLYQVSVTLNTAAMAAAYATPQTLVANPLASQLIIVHSANVYTASTGHTAYATGTAPIIQYSSGGTNGAHGLGTIATASGLADGDITAATSQVRTLLQAATAAVTGLSGLGIYFSNASGAYTAGTGTNVTFTLVYELLTATV